ncbi:MAG: hypothetical protein ISS90_00505 [Candidatus Omnitrophica bacterium]|nr:hypothetical protein [Candidatus Omnitrophota bacterium]
MFTFGIVKQIGEGKYLSDDLFIIERVRKERALNLGRIKPGSPKHRTRIIIQDDDPRAS